jgi:iron complex outermembrane receptor protein|tara:strand:- start:2749 stop:5067 length:2319 start_codon:yes stop_codon:yes gene_type:complete
MTEKKFFHYCTSSIIWFFCIVSHINADEYKASNRMIEEVMVVAQKREEKMQDIPISVQAFSENRLEAMGITSIADLQLVAPGMNYTETSGFGIIYIRGVGSDTFLMGDPNVATYLDGVYLPFAVGQNQELFGIEQIEVLKGPQGTLFGRGANGGAINIMTKSPSLTEPEAQLETGYDSLNTVLTKAYFSYPLADSLAMSISTSYKSGDHWYDKESRGGGEKLPQVSSQAMRIKLLWTPVDELELVFSYMQSLEQGTSSGLQGNSEPSLLAQAVGITPQTGYTVENDVPVYYHANNKIMSVTGIWSGDNHDYKFLMSRQDGSPMGLFIDFDGAPQSVAYFGTSNGAVNEVETAELQMISTSDGWAGSNVRYNLGYYWVNWVSALDPVFLGLAGIDLSTGVQNSSISLPAGFAQALDALLQPLLGFGTPSGAVRLVGRNTLDSHALYAQTSIDFFDAYTLTLGVRYQEETRTLDESSSALGDSNVDPVVYIQKYENIADKVTSTKPKIGLEYRPQFMEDTMLYISAQQSIKGTQFNLINIYDPPEMILPEEMEAIEVGIKTSPFGPGSVFNLAYFKYDIENLQVQFVSLLQGGAVTQENAGGAAIEGFEFEFQTLLLPSVIDNLVLIANGTMLTTKEYTEYLNGSGFDKNTGLLSTGNDFSGNEISRAPDTTGTVGVSKTTEVPGGTLEIGADYYYNSGFYYLAQNSEKSIENAYTVLNARISYFYEPENLRITLYGKNLEGTEYNYGRFHVDFGTADYKAPRDIVGLKVNWQF